MGSWWIVLLVVVAIAAGFGVVAELRLYNQAKTDRAIQACLMERRMVGAFSDNDEAKRCEHIQPNRD